VTFSSVAELDWVRTNVVVRRSKYEERIWVGASDLTKEGTWKWTSGELVPSHFWNPGEPNNQGGEHCAMFNKSKFNDARCVTQMMFVCKMGEKKHGFKNEMKLSDHLYSIEKNILDLKVNLTLLEKLMRTEKSSTIKSTTTT